MKRALVLVADGTPESSALARWIAGQTSSAEHLIAIDARDAARLVARRKAAHRSERVVSLVCPAPPESDIDGGAALTAVREWLRDLGPFERRTEGPARIAEALERDREGASDVLRLARLLADPKGTTSRASRRVERPTPRKRGRPAGSSDVFKGVGFDVCVAMLLEPARGWSERDLADRIGRSPQGVHRVLRELDARAYVRRSPGGTSLRDAELLRDDLASAWRSRFGESRAAARFVAPDLGRIWDDVSRVTSRSGADILLAGASAVSGPERPIGGPLFVYADVDDAAFRRARFKRVNRVGLADLIVWTPAENSVLLAPRSLDGRPATNRVVTYLDLMLGGDRDRRAAETIWKPSHDGA